MDLRVIHITKLEAAERQLRQAIRLFFDRGDMLAIHTLTAAAFQLFEDVGKVSTVEYFVEAGEAGPDETHRALYHRIEAQWDALSDAVGREPIDHHRLGSGVAPRDVWGVYSLTALTVPRPDEPGMQWELSFDSTEDDHLFTVIMPGWEPAGVRMDC